MDNFTIENIEGQFAVDSRLVAERLEIQHKNFLETIRKYQTKIEQRFGCIAFKTSNIKMPNGGVRQDISHCYLTENQATALMTFSRNTDAVIECKLDLVEAFSKAKELLIQPNQQPIQHQRLYWERLRLFESKTKIPLGYWCIFSEIGGLMRDLETGGVVLPAGACPDISVGKCWNPYLRSKGYDTNTFDTYKHHYPDHRGVCDAKIYPDELLALFREWLGFTYIPGKFPKYVRDICPVEDLELIAMAVGKEFQLRLKSA